MSRWHTLVYRYEGGYKGNPFVAVRLLGVNRETRRSWISPQVAEIVHVCDNEDEAWAVADLVALERCLRVEGESSCQKDLAGSA